MKRSLALLLLAVSPVVAQAQIPQAQPVDPTLQADPANDMYQRAKNLYDQGNASNDPDQRLQLLTLATGIFNQYLAQFPNHPNAEPAWLYLGQGLYKTGRIDDAKRCFHTLLNRYGKGIWVSAAAYTLAYEHLGKREYALAAPLFLKYAENGGTPESLVNGYFFAATSYSQLNQDRQSADLFRKVIDHPAGSLYAPQSKVALGKLLQKTGKLAEALELFESVVQSQASPALRGEAALKAALTATKLGQNDLADRYLKLIAITPGMEEFRSDAVVALMANSFSKKDYRGVLDAYRKSGVDVTDMAELPPGVQTPPRDDKKAERLMLAGRSSFQLKLPSEALRMFRQIERLIPAQEDLAYQAAYYRLLCFYEIDGEHLPDQVDAFMQIYRKGHANDPRIHTALLMKAESLFTRKAYEKAAPAYSEIDVTQISESTRPGMLFNRGWCLSEAGDPQGAIRSFSKFITDYPKEPQIPTAIAKRAKAYRDTGEPAKAIEDFDRLIPLKASAELTTISWLESARIRRDEGNLADMITRYRGLLENGKDLSVKVEAEANYFIGWGLAKTNLAADSVPYLEKARKLHPETYKKHAGLLLALGYFTAKNLDKLSEEIDLAMAGDYSNDLPDQSLQWAGREAYFAGRYAIAARFLKLVANPEEPRETPREVWRYLSKALVESGKPEEALKTIENVISTEDNPTQKADALLDKGRALMALKRDAESRLAVDAALELRPEGRIGGGVRMLSGELKLRAGEAGAAAGDFVYVVSFIDDRDLKPRALWRLGQALGKTGDSAGAAKYEQQLLKEFPAWKAPTE
jgi:tetratricopeptide (TPR) repeat protein